MCVAVTGNKAWRVRTECRLGKAVSSCPAADSPVESISSGFGALERQYSINEVAKLWGLSRETVRKLFRDRPGVLKISRPGLTGRRIYVTLRIPARVLHQVHRELSAHSLKTEASVPSGETRTQQRSAWLKGLVRRTRQKQEPGAPKPPTHD